jgi:predicted DNA-binding transcriptional regulator YafY
MSARIAAESLPYYAAPWSVGAITSGQLELLREAIAMRRKLRFDYVDGAGAATARVARPLGCFHWDSVWTLGAWCEHRTAFRSFRVDRMSKLAVLDESFRDEPGRCLPDYLRHVTGQSNPFGRASPQ